MNLLTGKYLCSLGLLGFLVGCSLPTPPGAPSTEPTVAPAAISVPQSNQIVADAIVVPERSVDLLFELSGTVVELFVQEGDRVAAGAPLAQLDTSDLDLQVEQSRASLAQAQASYDKIAAGATEEEIAAAMARRDQASAQLTQAQGSVTSSDIAAAQASLAQAQANLEALQRGPNTEPAAAAQAQVDQAQANLNSQRDSLSAAKTQAESQLAQEANRLRTTQDQYSQIYWDNRDLAGKVGSDLPQARVDQEAAALREVQNAEESLRQAQIALEQAQHSEVNGLQVAQARLDEALANQRDLFAAAGADEIAAAKAQVAQARANLDSLRGPERAGQVAAAAAAVRAAQASLDQTQAPVREVDLAEALARIEAAKVSVKQAERDRELATLHAPFAGTIAERALEVGQQVSGSSAPLFVLATTGSWKIETDNLNERDVVRFSLGTPVQLSFDALPDLALTGKVTAISPRGVDRYGDMTYTVTITPDTWDERLRWNMSAAVTIAETVQ